MPDRVQEALAAAIRLRENLLPWGIRPLSTLDSIIVGLLTDGTEQSQVARDLLTTLNEHDPLVFPAFPERTTDPTLTSSSVDGKYNVSWMAPDRFWLCQAVYDKNSQLCDETVVTLTDHQDSTRPLPLSLNAEETRRFADLLQDALVSELSRSTDSHTMNYCEDIRQLAISPSDDHRPIFGFTTLSTTPDHRLLTIIETSNRHLSTLHHVLASLHPATT